MFFRECSPLLALRSLPSSHPRNGKFRDRPSARRRQIAFAALCLAGAAWLSYASVQLILYKQIVAAKLEQIERQRIAYFDLLGEVSEYHEQFAEIARNLEDNQAYLLSLLMQDDQAAGKRADDGWRLKGSSGQHARIESTREDLRRKLKDFRPELNASSSRENGRGGATPHMARLVNRLTDMQDSQQAIVEYLTERTLSHIDVFKSTVTTTGIELDGLLTEPPVAGVEGDQGGPFIPGDGLVPEGVAASLRNSIALLNLYLDRRQSLQNAITSLPLGAPLAHIRVTSGFGSRPDPFSGRRAQHLGLDLAARTNTPVLATAPGRVVFAGWKGHYGRAIEIDHGRGVRSRYGHLRKMLVKIGQEVSSGEKIGLTGSSGRSTGPHLHYEVRVNEKPFDPMNFLNARRPAFKG